MTDHLDPNRLDSLWDFADPHASADRFRAELATAAPVAAAELSTQLARALGLAGHGSEADAVLDGIDSHDPTVRVRIALERGRRLNSSGRPTDAIPYFRDALEVAQSAGEDFLAVDALHMLAIADVQNAIEWAGRGIRVVESSTDARTQRWAIALHNNLGWFHFDAERYTEALVEFEAADAAARADGTLEQQRLAREAIAECREAWASSRETRSGAVDRTSGVRRASLGGKFGRQPRVARSNGFDTRLAALLNRPLLQRRRQPGDIVEGR